MTDTSKPDAQPAPRPEYCPQCGSIERTCPQWVTCYGTCDNQWHEAAPQPESAREWLCQGGGGFEDGEDGIRACTMSAEHAIELMDEYAAHHAQQLRVELEHWQDYFSTTVPEDVYTSAGTRPESIESVLRHAQVAASRAVGVFNVERTARLEAESQRDELYQQLISELLIDLESAVSDWFKARVALASQPAAALVPDGK